MYDVMKKSKLIIKIEILLFIILLSSHVSAFAVSSSYHKESPLVLSRGETKDIYLTLQNMVGNEDIIVKAAISEGSSIAELIDGNDTYLIPFGDKERVNIRVKIPNNARTGNYSLKLSLTSPKEKEGFGLGSSIEQDIPIIVQHEKLNSIELTIISIIILIAFILICKKKIFKLKNNSLAMKKKWLAMLSTIIAIVVIFLMLSSTSKAIDQQLSMNISLISSTDFVMTIVSPINATYKFSVGDNYTIDLDVSANFLVNTWWFNLLDLRHNTTINSTAFFTPNTTFSAARWSNKLIVYANDSSGNTANSNVTFFVSVPNSAPVIGSIASEIYVCEASSLSYYFNITDVDEDVLYSKISPRSVFYVTPSRSSGGTNSTTFQIISGTLDKDDVGGANNGSQTYERTISVSDTQYADTIGTNITVIEINNAPSIQNIGVQTIWGEGGNTTFYYQVNVTDTENGNQNSGNFSFNITISNSTNSIINLFNISQNGIMNFTANSTPLGVYNITVSVTDKGLDNPHQNISLCGQNGSNITSYINFSLTVTDENRQPLFALYNPSNLVVSANSTDALYFNITKYDPDGTIPDAYWYVDNVLIEYDTGSSFDEFIYSFGCGISGAHTIKAFITDDIENGLNNSVQWTILVYAIACPNISAPTGGGGVGTPFCKEKWGCDEWNTCQNLEKALKKGNITGENYRFIKENCIKNKLNEEICGFQTRKCLDFNYCSSSQKEKIEFQECHYTEHPNCHDNIKNCHDGECELLIDCGGPCLPCPTCSDDIQNQGEEGVDCGGPCPWSCPISIRELPRLKIPFLKYILIFIAIILVLLIINKTIKIFELKRKIHKVKMYNLLIIIIIFLSIIFFYLYSIFEIGDFVYKKDTQLIGEIKNKSIILKPLIQWQDGIYSKEYIFSIGKINQLDESEIRKALQSNNEQELELYSWRIDGEAFNPEMPIRTIEDLRRYTIKIGEEGCMPTFICGEWSDCRIDYNADNIMKGKLTSEKKYRLCMDYSRCMSDFLYSTTCEIKEPIEIKTIEKEGYIELYDEENKLVARITKKIIKGVEKLDIEIVV